MAPLGAFGVCAFIPLTTHKKGAIRKLLLPYYVKTNDSLNRSFKHLFLNGGTLLRCLTATAWSRSLSFSVIFAGT